MTNKLYIVEGQRTPFCKLGTSLTGETAAALGISAAKHVLTESGIDSSLIDEVIFGCVGQSASEMNVARIIGVRVGIPDHVPAVTVHRNCASGLESVSYASAKATEGKGSIFLTGGAESMSQMPLIYPKSAAKKFTSLFKSKNIFQKLKALHQFRVSDLIPQISLRLGLDDPLSGINMGQTAELLAREFGISRKEQDIYALLSHDKALASRAKLSEEIGAVYTTNNDCIASPSGRFVSEDNGPRENSTVEKLSRLKPVFDKREGTVTAGNSSQITDGAAALLLMTEEGLNKTGAQPIAKIVDYAHSGCAPSKMGLGPVFAIDKLGVNLKHMDLIEINEAFAAQVLAVQKMAKESIGEIPDEKLNINGGSIALGHPVGASGSRIILTLAKSLKRNGLQRGVAALCVGGGQGSAIHIEVCQ
ncbi:acetyl-CoA C-acyltransferase [Candidatus Woesebacteria bacterium]|nr:acetyl-CoA C-acyltransferase [Candidatus Woesebacteria bacterium]